jgi:hypothetical protein
LTGAEERGTLQGVQEVKSIGVTWQERGEGVNALPIFYLPKNFFLCRVERGEVFSEPIQIWWVLKENIVQKLLVFERRILRGIFGPTKENQTWGD